MNRNVNNVILYCNLKELMKEKKLSANYLSNEIQERRSTINDMINNRDMDKRQIPARIIAKLCVFLDISPNDLFEVTEFKSEE